MISVALSENKLLAGDASKLGGGLSWAVKILSTGWDAVCCDRFRLVSSQVWAHYSGTEVSIELVVGSAHAGIAGMPPVGAV